MIKPETPDNEAERLRALEDYRILDTLPEQAYDDIAKIAAQICGVPISLVSLIDENRQWIKAGIGIPSVIRELPRELSCCAHAINHDESLMEVEDASKDERFADNPLSVNEPHIQFYAGAPLISQDGFAVGTLCVIDHEPRKLSEEQKQSLLALSRQVMALLELRKETQLFQRNKTRLQELAENISDVIYDLDESGKFTYVNPALIELSGYTENDLLEKSYFDLIHPDYMEALGQFYYEQIKAGKDSSYYEFPIVSKSGEMIWLGQTIKIFFDGERVERVGAVAKDVTELKRVRKELESSEEQYRLLSENSANLVCLQNLDGRFTYVSPSLKEMTGYDEEEFMDLNPAKLCHPEDMDRVIEEFQVALNGQDAITQYRFLHKDGHYVWLESVARAAYDEGGNVINLQTSSRDISERKQSELRIRREEANLKALIENSTDIIWSVDNEYKYITFNSHFQQSVKEQLGIELSIGQSLLYPSLPEKTSNYWRKLYERAFRGERFIEHMKGITHKDQYYECSFNPIIEEKDKVIGVSVFARDITDRVKTEKKRVRFQQGLELLNNLSANIELDYSDLIQRSLTEVATFFEMEVGLLSAIEGEQYLVRYVTELSGQFGLTENSSFNLGDTFCEIAHKEQQIIAIDHTALSEFKDHPCYKVLGLESYLGAPVSIGREAYGTLALGSTSPRKSPFDLYEKEFFEVFTRWVGAVLERRNYEKLLVESKDRAENASRAKANFLSTMSHEIRTPLNAIIGMTHILLQENPKANQIENLNILKFSGENLLVLVNDVLDINKIESGKLILEQSDFNLKELLESIRNALIYSIEDKGLNSKINYDADLPEIVTGDSVRLAQIINNLMSNAIKFTKSGAVTILAENRGVKDGVVSIYLEVKDSGIGLSENELNLIFERFMQARTSTTREYGGSGLGLSIVKGLLELMGSKIQVESSPEGGSKFYFEIDLPIAEKPRISPVRFQPDIDRVSISDIHILLVEDNKVNQLVAEKFLKKWDIEVSIAENGQEAVDLLENGKRFDLILMDLQMPIMDGYEATKRIREMDKEVPILALTASVRVGQKNRAMRVGMNDFLIKPLTPTDLYSKISRFISDQDITEMAEEDHSSEQVSTQFKALREMLQGDDEFKAEVVPLYIKNIQSISKLLPKSIQNGDVHAADRLRHKMLTTLHTLEATTIRSLIDDGIALIGKKASDQKMSDFSKELSTACQNMEEELTLFMEQP